MTETPGILIVGFGAAGLSAAQALRLGGWEGGLTILSAEDSLPYDRPPLSKEYLSGASDFGDITLQRESQIAALHADIRYGIRATGLDIERKIVRASDGREYPYSDLIIATGLISRSFPGTENLENVYTLRDRADADALGARLRAGEDLLIIGGGFIGLEVAATARSLGVAVTVVEPLPVPLGPKLGDDIAGRLVALHRDNGVVIRAGVGIDAVLADESGTRATGVRLSSGEVVNAAVILAAVGAMPDVEWLADSGLNLENGIGCDEYNRAADHVWAAGDIARWVHPLLGQPMRLEHRINAAEQGRAVAGNILGDPTPFAPVPFFWTDHYDVRIQSAGTLSPEKAPVAVHGALDEPAFVIEYRSDEGVLLGTLNWNAARKMIPLRRELAVAPPVALLELDCPACGAIIEGEHREVLYRNALAHTVDAHRYEIPRKHVFEAVGIAPVLCNTEASR